MVSDGQGQVVEVVLVVVSAHSSGRDSKKSGLGLLTGQGQGGVLCVHAYVWYAGMRKGWLRWAQKCCVNDGERVNLN